MEDEHFREPVELAGNLTAGLLGDPAGPADQGSIVVDAGDVAHAVWRRTAARRFGDVVVCAVFAA